MGNPVFMGKHLEVGKRLGRRVVDRGSVTPGEADGGGVLQERRE